MTTGNEPPVPAEPPEDGPNGGTPSPLHGNHRLHTGKGRFERSPATVARDAQAADYRAQGWTLQEIADELGYPDRSNARKAIQRALRDVVQGPAEKLLALYVDRLEDIFQRSMEISEADHVVVSHGKIICDSDGNPLRDHSATLAAYREARAALADVRKMVGLDQPTKVEHSGELTYQVVGVDPQDIV